jgi:hypothetical protein
VYKKYYRKLCKNGSMISLLTTQTLAENIVFSDVSLYCWLDAPYGKRELDDIIISIISKLALSSAYRR